MTENGIFQVLLYLAALLICIKPLGAYMARVYQGELRSLGSSITNYRNAHESLPRRLGGGWISCRGFLSIIGGSIGLRSSFAERRLLAFCE